MSLLDDLNNATRQAEQGARRCSVCEAFANLPPDEGESLRKALASPLGAKRLSIILQNNGVSVGVPSIHLHRQEGHTP
jgi:hypothetical protein